MSLLMEALRKAEEAKRLAAKKDRAGSTEAEPEALALQPEADAASTLLPESTPESFAMQPLIEFEDSETEHSLATQPDSEIPFDFQIDDAFHSLTTPEQPPLALEPSPPFMPETHVETWTEELAQALPTTEPVDFKEVSYFSELGLVDAPEPEPEPEPELEPIAEDIAEAGSLALEQTALELVSTATPPVETAISSQPLLSAEQAPAQEQPLRALRVEDNEDGRRVETASTSVTSTTALEAQKRESARAVFNAKLNARTPSSGVRKYAPLAALLLLVLAAGGGYLYFIGMAGGSGNQYNIPAASFDSGEYSPPEQGLAELDVAELPDLGIVEPMPEEQPVAVLEENAVPEESAVLAESVVPEEPVALAAVSPEPALAIAPLAVSAPPPQLNSPAPAVLTPPSDKVQAVSAVPLASPAAVASTPGQDSAASVAAGETATPPVASLDVIVPEAPVAPQQQTSAPIQVLRTDTTPRINPQIVQAYAAFQQQNYLEARAQYQQVLLQQPTNRDALLGLAAVALRTGEPQQARTQYAKLLELDPRDALAQVGLMETMPATNPQEVEYTLKRLFSEHPDVAALAFSLGNLYAAQGRWNEAQQSYYDALLSAKASASAAVAPDYAFNLAVSLERLNQLPAAYNFYREALTLSQNAPYAFDIRVLRERLDVIERVLP